MSENRVIYDHPDFTVEQDYKGRFNIKMSAGVFKANSLQEAGNLLLNRVYEVSQEIHKFATTYVDPFAPTVRPRRMVPTKRPELEPDPVQALPSAPTDEPPDELALTQDLSDNEPADIDI